MAIKIHGGEDTPLVQCINPILDKWMVLWAIGYEDNSFTFMAEEIGHKPTLQEIKDIVLGWCNADIDKDLRDFYISAMSYVTNTLATGWQAKDKIDWTVYEDLLK